MLTTVVIVYNVFSIFEMVFAVVVIWQIRNLVELGLALAILHATRGAELDYTA